MGPDDELLGVVVHSGLVFGRSRNVVAALRRITAFPTGLAVDTVVLARDIHAQAAGRRAHAATAHRRAAATAQREDEAAAQHESEAAAQREGTAAAERHHARQQQRSAGGAPQQRLSFSASDARRGDRDDSYRRLKPATTAGR